MLLAGGATYGVARWCRRVARFGKRRTVNLLSADLQNGTVGLFLGDVELRLDADGEGDSYWRVDAPGVGGWSFPKKTPWLARLHSEASGSRLNKGQRRPAAVPSRMVYSRHSFYLFTWQNADGELLYQGPRRGHLD
jgi:hypothetical protein